MSITSLVASCEPIHAISNSILGSCADNIFNTRWHFVAIIFYCFLNVSMEGSTSRHITAIYLDLNINRSLINSISALTDFGICQKIVWMIARIFN